MADVSFLIIPWGNSTQNVRFRNLSFVLMHTDDRAVVRSAVELVFLISQVQLTHPSCAEGTVHVLPGDRFFSFCFFLSCV